MTIIKLFLRVSSPKKRNTQPGTPRYTQVKSRILRQGLLHLFQQDTQATLLASQGSLDAIPSTLGADVEILTVVDVKVGIPG